LDSSPSPYSSSQRVTLALLPSLAAVAIRSLLFTCQWQVSGREHWDTATRAHGPVIIALWHESIAFASYYFRKEAFCALSSQSFDGEIAARLVGAFGHTVVRGSTTHGGSAALRGMAEVLDRGRNITLTLDGPKGPRRLAKPGVGILSARTQTHVMPIAFSVEPVRHLKSWDRFPLPPPFARIRVLMGPAIPPPGNDSRENVEAARLQTEFTLNSLHARIPYATPVPVPEDGPLQPVPVPVSKIR